MIDFLALFTNPGYGAILIVIAFLFVTVLLLGLNVWSKWHWGVKASMTLIAGLMFAGIYFSVLNMQGWPTTEQLPKDFQVVWYYADPPNARINKEGFIVLWILHDGKEIERRPRAYEIEYDKKIHKKLQRLRKAMQKGGIRGKRKGSPIKGKNAPPDATSDWLKFYKMPKPTPPIKR